MKAPAERPGWTKNRRISWTWDHVSGASVFPRTTLAGGYWLASHPSYRRYGWEDCILRGKRGYNRRFRTAEAAQEAAEQVS